MHPRSLPPDEQGEKRGSIVNIASIMAIKPGFGNANYSAAKGGLIALTKAAAKELGRFHITLERRPAGLS